MEKEETLDDILAQCCKVCGAYRCHNHLDWIICSECPYNGKYDPKGHDKCPFCGKVQKAD